MTNVYHGDLEQIAAWTGSPRRRLYYAALMRFGQGLGPDRIVWGTDAVWTKRAAMADRRAETPRNPRGRTKLRLCAARHRQRLIQIGHLRRQHRPPLQFQAGRRTGRPDHFIRTPRLTTSKTAPAAADCATATSAIPADRRGLFDLGTDVAGADEDPAREAMRRRSSACGAAVATASARCEQEYKRIDHYAMPEIQRFEFLRAQPPGPAALSSRRRRQHRQFERMPFADLITLGSAQGLLHGDWPAWRQFREMRSRTSHRHDANAAMAGGRCNPRVPG